LVDALGQEWTVEGRWDQAVARDIPGLAVVGVGHPDAVLLGADCRVGYKTAQGGRQDGLEALVRRGMVIPRAPRGAAGGCSELLVALDSVQGAARSVLPTAR